MNDKEYYLLIGAAGQIGNELTKKLALRSTNCQILAIDKNLDPNHQMPKNVIAIKEDVKTLNLIDILGEKIISASNVRFIYNAAVSFFSPFKIRTRSELNETFEVNAASAISCYKSFLEIRERLKIEKKRRQRYSLDPFTVSYHQTLGYTAMVIEGTLNATEPRKLP